MRRGYGQTQNQSCQAELPTQRLYSHCAFERRGPVLRNMAVFWQMFSVSAATATIFKYSGKNEYMNTRT